MAFKWCPKCSAALTIKEWLDSKHIGILDDGETILELREHSCTGCMAMPVSMVAEAAWEFYGEVAA